MLQNNADLWDEVTRTRQLASTFLFLRPSSDASDDLLASTTSGTNSSLRKNYVAGQQFSSFLDTYNKSVFVKLPSHDCPIARLVALS